MAVLTSLLSAALAVAPPCAPITGWEKVVASSEVRWIIVGELHGTVETPAIFADAVCLTAQIRGPLIVALEMPKSDQARIDAFITSDGGPAAKAEFLNAAFWQGAMKDGRSSEAFLRLLDRLREMHAAGQVTRVVAFQDVVRPDDPPGDQGPYERRMAATVRDAAAPGTTVVALVGNLHAMKTEVSSSRRFMPMASHLPGGETITLNALGNGGSAWNCSTSADCGAHENRAPVSPRERGVDLISQIDGAYDGLLNLGVTTTASPPQAAP